MTQKYSAPPSSVHQILRAAVASRLFPFAACAVPVLGLALCTLSSCSKEPETPPAPATPPPAPPTPQPTKTPTPVPTPEPTPTPSGPPTPTPIVHHYAPKGEFYVTEEATVPIKGGLIGVSPGTKVNLVQTNGDKSIVSDGQHVFEIKTLQLTNDLDEAAKMTTGVQQAQAAADAARQQAEAVERKQQEDRIKYLQAHPLGGGSTTGTPTPTPTRRR